MTDMVERVARAICRAAARKIGMGRPYLDEQVDRLWPNYIPQARAAIEAMLEPTEAMQEAADNGWNHHGNFGGLSNEDARDIWQAMVKEALK